MTDHHPALQYAHYQLKDKTGIPAHLFQVNEEYLQAANKIIPKPSFQRDSEVIAFSKGLKYFCFLFCFVVSIL